MVQIDDPAHARLRRFVNQAFSSQRIAGMREKVVAISDEYSNLHEAHGALAEFTAYVTSLVDRSRQDTDSTDLFAELVATEDNGTFMSNDERVSMFVQLLFAGRVRRSGCS